MLRFALNEGLVEVEANLGLPALDYLRDEARLTGVKHACREGDCGSCVVLLGHLDNGAMSYQSVTSCLLPLGALECHHLVTIEGLNRRDLTPFQRALEIEGASQCGFCTPGFVVSFAGFLLRAEEWDLQVAIEAIAGNICRCTGYASIVRAMASTLDRIRDRVDPAESRIPALVREELLPEYFLRTPDLLAELGPPPSKERPTSSQVVVSGGTDLYVQRPDELVTSDVFVMPPSAEPPIRVDGGHIYLTGAATAEDMKTSRVLAEKVGGLDRAMSLMGSLPIRHRATIAGNIINASPIGDMTVILLALDAEIGLQSGEALRSLPLRDFFLDYKELDRCPDELVEWVRFQSPGDGAHFNFEKVSKRTHLDIASVNTAASLRLDDGRIAHACLAAGGVAPIPMQLPRTADFLFGRKPLAETAIGAAAFACAEVAPISDVRGSADYKRLLLGQLVLAHFNVLFGLEEGLVTEAIA
jgi:xanthine dehydrogenase small subunit